MTWLYVPGICSLSATATAAPNSPCDPWHGYEPWLVLSGTPTQRPSSWRGWKNSRLDQAPVWDDLCTFDGSPWRGRVDIVAAGFPCQPFSAAGQRGGVDDDRWLWPDIGRIIADVGPRWVLLENVGQLVRHGLPEVLHDLAQLGFDAEWGLYAASDVGAPHKRQRFWLVGHASSTRRSEVTGGASGDEGSDGWEPHRDHLADGADEAVADADRDGRQTLGWSADERARQLAHRSDGALRAVGELADTPSVDEREPHHAARAIARRDPRGDARWLGYPPRPDDTQGWEQWIADGGPQPTVRRGTDGPPVGLADALHLGGNGLVPQCAAEAWRQLIERAGW